MADETEIPDTGGTNPQGPQPGTTPSTTPTDPTQIDQNQATPDDTNSGTQGGGQVPATPADTAAQHPFPGEPSQTQQNGPQGGADLSKAVEGLPDKPESPAVTQAVSQASGIHKVLQALAGGPTTKTTINPNTGEVERTQVPTTNARFGMSIALAALTGAFNGLAQKGPGAEGRAAAGGFNEALQQKQQQQQAQDEEASKTYARQAAIAQTNFTMHQTAQRMGQLDYEAHKEFVGDAAAGLTNVKAAGADLESGVREEDLLKKYNITKNNAIPDGIAPRMDARPGHEGEQAEDKYGQKLWDNTYTVIDPQKKIALDQGTAQFLADHHVPGYFTQGPDGKPIPKDFSGSAQIKAGLYVNGLAQASAIKTTEAQVNAQLAKLPGDAGKVDGKVFEANLTDGLDKGTVTTKALQAFAPYASMPLDQALDAMRKNKVDPTSISQIASLVPSTVQDALKNQRLESEGAEKAKIDAAAAVTKQQAELPGQIAEVAAKSRVETAAAGQRAFNEETGRQKAKSAYDSSSTAIKDMVKNPKLNAIPDISETPVNGVNQQYVKALQDADPNMAAVVKAIGEGRQLQSKYGLAKEDGQRLAAIVNRAYPEYSQPKAEAYEKLLNSFTSGPDKTQIESGNTTYRHIQDYVETANKLGSSVPGAPTRISLGKDASQLVEEVNSAYTKGVLHEDQRANLIDGLTSVNPIYRQSAARELTKLLSAKTSEKLGTFRRGKVTSATPDFEVVSPEAKDAYQFIMGNEADPNFGTSRTSSPSSGSQSGMSQAARASQPKLPSTPRPAGAIGVGTVKGVPVWVGPNNTVMPNQ